MRQILTALIMRLGEIAWFNESTSLIKLNKNSIH